MNRPLSVSAAQLYLENPAEYKASYIDGIRPIVQMSYFIYGRAVDLGCNALLLKQGDAKAICEKELKNLLVEKVEFIPADYDGELLDEDTKLRVLIECQMAGYKGNDVDSLMSSLLERTYKDLSEGQRKALAVGCFYSLKAKAFLMLDAFETQVLPKLSDIKDVQKEYRWKDEFGNEFIAIIDFRAKYEGIQATMDNKTSSNPHRDYDEKSVLNSFQFNVYTPQTKDDHAAYIVMDKRIKKNRIRTCEKCNHIATSSHKTCPVEVNKIRCDGNWVHTIKPEAEILIRLDRVSPREQKLTKKTMTDIANAIKAGIFPNNLKAHRKMYGSKEVLTPYYEYYRSGSMEGLKKRDR